MDPAAPPPPTPPRMPGYRPPPQHCAADDEEANRRFDELVAARVGDPGEAACPGLATTRLSSVTAERVTWVWPGRLPARKLVMLDGDPATGKSTLAVDLAARVTTGSPMPDGHRLDGPRSVIIVSAEDGTADTIRPRFDAAGGDPDRAVIWDGVRVPVDDEHPEAGHRVRPPSIPGDLGHLRALVEREQAALVVVDVLAAYMGSVDGHRDTDVRSVLMPLARLAEDTGACIVCVRHLNKGGGSNAIYRGGGSIAFIGAARVGLIAAADPDDETRRVLAVSKSNLAAVAPALAYRLVSADEHGCARIEWLGATNHRAGDLLALPDSDEHDTADAADALGVILADGPLWANDAIKAMGEAGFSKDQSKRAKKKLTVRSVRIGKPGDDATGWQWELSPLRERDTPEGSEGSSNQNPAPLAPLGANALPSGAEDRAIRLITDAFPGVEDVTDDQPSWDEAAGESALARWNRDVYANGATP